MRYAIPAALLAFTATAQKMEFVRLFLVGLNEDVHA